MWSGPDDIWGRCKRPRNPRGSEIKARKITRGCGVHTGSDLSSFSMNHPGYRRQGIGWNSLKSGGERGDSSLRSQFDPLIVDRLDRASILVRWRGAPGPKLRTVVSEGC